jgi:hypothetical protein
MQISATDRRGGDAHDRVGGLLNVRIIDVIEPYIPNTLPYNSFHDLRLSW